MKEAFPFIVADVGGTHARFGLVAGMDEDTRKLELCQQQIYLCQDFINFQDLLGGFIASLDGVKPIGGSVAIAGPVLGDQIRMTNLTWNFSIQSVKKQFGFRYFRCINDFGALAYATLQLEGKDLHLIHEGVSNPMSSRAVVGPGTGLGVAGLVRYGDHWVPVAGEGGHMTCAPANRIEMEVRNIIEPGDKHISAERFVSGPGLVNLYKALTIIHGKSFEALSPSEISRRAIEQIDDECEKALQMFYQMLGSVAGNVCLVMGAFGAVYLGGGILPQIESPEMEKLIVTGFQHKGRMQPLLNKVPLYLMKGEYAALQGAAYWHYDSLEASDN